MGAGCLKVTGIVFETIPATSVAVSSYSPSAIFSNLVIVPTIDSVIPVVLFFNLYVYVFSDWFCSNVAPPMAVASRDPFNPLHFACRCVSLTIGFVGCKTVNVLGNSQPLASVITAEYSPAAMLLRIGLLVPIVLPALFFHT